MKANSYCLEGQGVMGKTMPNYIMVLEGEISCLEWFERALRKEDREEFEALLCICRNFASESGNATDSEGFRPHDYHHNVNLIHKNAQARVLTKRFAELETGEAGFEVKE
jgi:hypothetical protein